MGKGDGGRNEENVKPIMRDSDVVALGKSIMENYCPKCGVWYPALSDAHANH